MKGKKTGGRKLAYSEPTTTIAFRIPKSKAETIRKLVNNYLAKLKKI